MVYLCLDMPAPLQDSITNIMTGMESEYYFEDPYFMHKIIIEEVIALYDRAVWSFRALVRGTEMVWPPLVPFRI
jgi:hypothetical protein